MFYFYTPENVRKPEVFYVFRGYKIHNVLFLYPLKMSENPWFSDVIRGYRNGILDYWNGIEMEYWNMG